MINRGRNAAPDRPYKPNSPDKDADGTPLFLHLQLPLFEPQLFFWEARDSFPAASRHHVYKSRHMQAALLKRKNYIRTAFYAPVLTEAWRIRSFRWRDSIAHWEYYTPKKPPTHVGGFLRKIVVIVLWAKMDSNHRRYKPADLQSAPFGHSGIRPFALQSYVNFIYPPNLFVLICVF